MKIIGIGASAGGVQALSDFLVHLPLNLEVPFVLVKHLPPNEESALQRILSKKTTYPVITVEDEVVPEPGKIYLHPPGHHILYEGGKLRLLPPEPSSHLKFPIDRFFGSLAKEAGEEVVAIILSGAGSDGSRGARAIKDRGGLVLVQDPESAEFNQMPKAAINMEIVDYKLRPGILAEKLGKILKHKQNFTEKRALINLEARADHSYFDRILNYLKNFSDIDFSKYRESTLVRRLEKRLLLHQSETLEDYFHLLNGNRSEMASLFADFVISVTQFFRDEEAFNLLSSQIIPDIVDQSSPDKTIRVWVPACATGEEAYSVAIALSEHFRENDINREFKVFGSDISQNAINFAASGLYPSNIESEMPGELLSAYFVKEENHYRVRKSLREKMLFALQDVLRDPPFIRMDLISCRNLLIYLKPEAQRNMLATFYFALNPGAYLFLGSSESTGELKYAFDKISTRWSFYQKKEDSKMINLAPRERNLEKLHWTPPVKQQAVTDASSDRPQAEEDIDPFARLLIDRYAPSSIFLDKQLNILYIHGEMDHILKVPRALPRMNLHKMVDKEDISLFRTGVQRAIKSEHPVILKNVSLSKSGQEIDLSFKTVEFPELDNPVIQVEIISSASEQPSPPERKELGRADYLQERIKTLKEELQNARRQTNELVKELGTTNEELESSNRELLASNEELQSTNLELQSINEELYSVNSELYSKNDELNIANSDLKNLLKSTGIGTVFLDNQLRIRRFTPAVRQQFKLLDTDLGRPITDFSTSFDSLDIGATCEQVLNTLNSFEKEVSDSQGSHYLLRILPYRTEKDEIRGLVMTFVEISELIETRALSSRSSEQFEVLFEHTDHILLMIGRDKSITKANHPLGKYSVQQLEGQSLTKFIPGNKKEKVDRLLAASFHEAQKGKVILTLSDFKSHPAFYDLTFIPSTESRDQPFVLVVAEDVTLRELLKEEISISLTRYQNFMEHTRRPIALINAQWGIVAANRSFRSLYPERIDQESRFYELLPEKDRENTQNIIRDIFEGKPYDELELPLGKKATASEKLIMFATPVILQDQIKYVALISSRKIEQEEN